MQERIEIVKTSVLKQLTDISQLSGINSLILSVCLTDTLAGFYCGFKGDQGGNKKRYNAFLSKYLPAYREKLYDIRCNLTHSFSNTLSGLLFIDNAEFTKVFGADITILGSGVFSIDTFKSYLAGAVERYFQDLSNEENTDLRTNFNVRYEHLGILHDSKIAVMRNLKGEIVSHYDKLDSMPGLDLKIAVADGLPLKK
jgi:hypothetical protein